MEKKYTGITEDAVNAGIADGRFSEAWVRQIRDQEGLFVKHIKKPPHTNSLLPASVIQVNQTYIYQADLRPVMLAIARSRDLRIADDLSERYRVVMSKLERFLDHRRNLEILNDTAGDAADVFELRLSPMLDDVNLRNPDVDACKALINMLRAQVNIEFVYLLSTFWIDRASVSDDKGLPRRLSTLESKVQRALEQILAYQYDSRSGFTLRDSLYGKYLLQGKNGLSHLQRFVEDDSRFSSYDDFMLMIFNHRLEYTGKVDYLGCPIGDASYGFKFTVDGTHFEDDERHGLACDFHEVLRDIQHVSAILEELKAARIIEPDDIRCESGVNASDPPRLMAIPLQLPKPSPQ